MERVILTWSTEGNTQILSGEYNQRGAVDTLEGWAALQRDHHRLEKQAAVNIMQFRDRKCKPD